MMAIGIVGGLVSAFGALQSSMYQAAVAKANAKQANLNAGLAMDTALRDAEDLGTEQAGLMGEQLVGQAASGLAVSSPSAIRSRLWMSDVGYKDQLRRVEAGTREWANYKTQGNVFQSEAAGHTRTGIFNFVGSSLSTISTAFTGTPPGGGGGGSFAGSARPTTMSPGYLPVPLLRNRYYSSGMSVR